MLRLDLCLVRDRTMSSEVAMPSLSVLQHMHGPGKHPVYGWSLEDPWAGVGLPGGLPSTKLTPPSI